MTFLTNPNDIQKSVLSALLAKYNNSKTFKGSNKVHQTFSVKPEEIFSEYNDDFANAAAVKAFEDDLAELEGENLITLQKHGQVVTRIDAVCENIPDYHKLIGTEDKRTMLTEAENILQSYIGRNETLDKICLSQLERIRNCKTQNIAKDNDKLKEMLKCLDYILCNKEEILERELSILLFGDSKFFESKLKTKVCLLLLKYSEVGTEFSDDEQSVMRAKILSHYLVVKNPTYFYIKGNGLITFKDGTKVELSCKYPIALRSDSVSEILSVTIPCDTVMTVENLTSFNRVTLENCFCLFLSGYNNSGKADFLKKLCVDNHERQWLHFGDIDPDGFYILHNLRIKTGINFQPYLMGIFELERFMEYCKPLEANDIAKAKSMIESNIFSDIAQFMLKNNCKLEQEIISLKGV